MRARRLYLGGQALIMGCGSSVQVPFDEQINFTLVKTFKEAHKDQVNSIAVGGGPNGELFSTTSFDKSVHLVSLRRCQ